jgi:putative N6-adenine-specific DNA methylase
LQLIAKTLAGLEQILADELTQLGATNVQALKRAVQFEGDQRLLYRANLELRTALRILMPVHSFRADHDNMLYKRVKQIDWSQYMDVNDTLAIDAVVNSPFFNHSKFAALRAKDAIVDQFRNATGQRPNVDVHSPTLCISLHISTDQCTLSLDSSGDSLHMRGYRAQTVEAPINEVLAAGLIQLSGWKADSDFIDPMCGSGTLLIEAATYAYNIAPHLYRERFGFMKWKDFNAKLWQEVCEQARRQIKPFKGRILGFDQDFQAVKAARLNILAARLEGKIEVERQKLENLTPPASNGLIMINPPYDERLTDTHINDLYKMIGDRLKQEFAGFEAWIISSNFDALKSVGLRPSKKMTLFNGPLECKFQKFDLYQGSKKIKNPE